MKKIKLNVTNREELTASYGENCLVELVDGRKLLLKEVSECEYHTIYGIYDSLLKQWLAAA